MSSAWWDRCEVVGDDEERGADLALDVDRQPRVATVMQVSFYGVRGSTPSSSEENRRYGGNTSTVLISGSACDPIILDLGTGLRVWGHTQPLDGTFRATALVTHVHWDHIQGLPFLTPIDRAGARLDVYAPSQADATLEAVFDDFMRPPYFPIRCGDLRGEIAFHSVEGGDFEIGKAKITVRPVPHTGPTVGYRVDCDGASVAYISDHQAPDDLETVAGSVLELCDGADLLIHDAQYTAEEFAAKPRWGHCPMAYALVVAREAGVRRLCLFHHDPSHGDDELDRLHAGIRAEAAAFGVEEVIGAREGLVLQLRGTGLRGTGLRGTGLRGTGQ